MSNESIINLARPEIIAMSAYRSARSERTTGNVWLDANENPYDEFKQYNRYPEPQPNKLITALSRLYNVSTEYLLATRGSDEGIDLLIRTFCTAKQDKILICPPTYGMYKVAACIQGVDIIEAPLIKAKNFELDSDLILQLRQPDIKLIFLCSPNNPTGNLLKTADILNLCYQLSNKAIIVVDEAYIEFADDNNSLTSYLFEIPNLIVLRTLSKAYGLAGIRCGATLANPAIIQLLKKVIASYPIPSPIVDVVCQKLQPENLIEVSNQITVINAEKNALSRQLSKLTFVKKVWGSQTNFILCEVDDANEIISNCRKQGIIIRNRSNEYQLNNCVRITIGTPTENKFLLEALKNV